MWFPSIPASRRSRSGRVRPPRKVSRRLFVEFLEYRSLLSFLAPVSYPVGVNPQAVAVGDFTGTGIPDLVVGDSQGVGVLMGKGDGTFAPAVRVDSSPGSVAVGDFNRDGKLDMVVAGSSIDVLLGNGDGTFKPATSFAGGIGGDQSVAVGDFSSDGKPDIVTLSSTGVSVFLGNGDGNFQPPKFCALPSVGGLAQTAVSMAEGDFNRDGKLDLVVTGYTQTTYYGYYGPRYVDHGYVNVLLGNGDGTFTPGSTTAASYPYPGQTVAVGDFRGDGKLDVVQDNGGNNTVSVFLGNGDGTLQAPTIIPAYGGYGVAVADFNRDGKLDIVTLGNYHYGDVSVLLGNGNGTFQPALNFTPGTYPTAMAVGEFNRDGWPDLAVTNSANGIDASTGTQLSINTVSVVLNAADWSQASSFAVSGFPSPVTTGTAGSFTVTVKNADGSTDANYTGTVHFTSSDSKAVLPANYTFTGADAGKHTFSATLKTAGTQSITATDTVNANLHGADSAISVKPAVASMFVLSAPSSVTAGVAFSLTVTVEDAYGNIVIGYAGTIHFSSSDSRATLPANYTFTASDNGVHTFTGLLLRKTGYQTITVTDTHNSAISGKKVVDVV